jgi:transmembrane sensor
MTINEKILETATDWLLLIEEDASVAVSEPFERWLHASPLHIRAFSRVSNTWERMAPERLGLAARLLVLWRRGASLFRVPGVKASGLSLASCMALAGLFIIYTSLAPLSGDPAFYSAGVGEVRTVTLADTSTLYLDTDTSASVRLSSSNRIVALDRGRVFVDVNSQDPRTFKVTAGQIAFTATGTAYAVRALDAGYRLEVYEGTVEIRRNGRLLGAVRAGAGARVSGFAIDRFTIPSHTGETSPDWTRNRIAFTATPLAEAIAQFNRYSRKTIILGDTTLGDRPVSGTFALNDVDAFLQAVTLIVDTPLHENDRTVIIGK